MRLRMNAMDLFVHRRPDETHFGSFWWFAYLVVSCFLVLFAGLMSGLTLGLMSLSLVDLEILQRSGTSLEKKRAVAIFPVIQRQHQLLVTLLLCNACSMEALPICLDKLCNPFLAIVMSVTFVLVFGEVIPQAICSRYGLAVGASFLWLVRILMIICYPIAYPLGKLLDYLFGHNESELFRRAQLKVLVSIHGKDAGKGGELSRDETTIISGALDLTEKTAEQAMTPIVSTFSLDVNSTLDGEAIANILARGHSRIPVYSENPENIVGLLLVKTLLTVRAEKKTPVSAVSIRRIPRVPAEMPLYDILKEFQKGHSHMAAVVKTRRKFEDPLLIDNGDDSIENKVGSEYDTLTTHLLAAPNEILESSVVDIEKGMNSQRHVNSLASFKQNVAATNMVGHLLEGVEEEEIIGIITIEDVFEEILQEEIVDETDEYVDVHQGIPVPTMMATHAATRVRPFRRLASLKQSGSTPKKSARSSPNSTRFQAEFLSSPPATKS